MEDENETMENHPTRVTREADYRLINVNDGFLNLMTVDGMPKDDVRLPEGQMGSEIQAGFQDGKDLIVTVRTSDDEDTVLGYKLAPKK